MTAMSRDSGDRGDLGRNMLNHPVVLKVYVFTPNFAREFRYNERALVYSGLLAARADFTGGTARTRRKLELARTEAAAFVSKSASSWKKQC